MGKIKQTKPFPVFKVKMSQRSGSGFVDNLKRSRRYINKVEFNSKEGHTGWPAH